MKLERTKAWWMKKADEEAATVGARSKKTLTPIELTPDQKRHLRKLSKRKPIDYDQVIGGRRRRGWVWRPGNFLFAFHRMFTWRPRGHWQRGWYSIWWFWFEASYAEAPNDHRRAGPASPDQPKPVTE